MVVGWFSFTGHPFVKVLITIPRLGIQDEVDLLVDTGADGTCLNHRDAVNMGLFPDVLRESDRTRATGIGGSSRYFREDAQLEFLDADDDPPREYPVSLRIADLSDTPMPILSLLGRDILNLHRMVYAPAERRLELHAPDCG